jgi:hypothetical protein
MRKERIPKKYVTETQRTNSRKAEIENSTIRGTKHPKIVSG